MTAICYTRPPQLQALRDRLGRNGAKPIIYGGFLRDLLCLGHNETSGDIDVLMSIEDFLKLKSAEDDIRRGFVLHEPHLLFMLHQLQDDTFTPNPRPIVLRLKPEYQAAWGLTHPLGLMLSRTPLDPAAILPNNDLGFNALCDGPDGLITTPQFEEDRKNRTITMIRCNDARDYARTLQRLTRFTSGAYQGWQAVIPERFAGFAAEAAELLAKQG